MWIPTHNGSYLNSDKMSFFYINGPCNIDHPKKFDVVAEVDGIDGNHYILESFYTQECAKEYVEEIMEVLHL